MDDKLAKIYYGPGGPLERYRRDQKISRGRQGALADIPSRAEANSSAEIRRSHTQRGPPGGPSFSATRQTAPRAQSFQIRADRCRRGQPLQRGRTLDFEKF